MKGKYFVISVLSCLCAFNASAQTRNQDSLIGGATFEITQSYKPEVTQAPHPEFIPTLPPYDTTRPSFNYNVPQQTLFYRYSSQPLRPLAFDVDSADEGFSNYIKLGGGNLSTIYLDAGITALKGIDYSTSIHLQHLSQKGSISDQKSSLTGLDVAGTLHKLDRTFTANLGIHRNQFHYYGYDHTLFNYNQSTVRQAFMDIDLDVTMQNDVAGDFDYKPTIGVSLYSDQFNANETTFKLAVPVTYNIDSSLQIYITPGANITSFKNSITTQSNNAYGVGVGLNFSKNIFTGHAGITPTWGNNGNQYFLPDVEVAFTIPETQFAFTVGAQGTLQQNTYKELSTLNPFMYNTYTVTQTPATEIFGGIKSNLGNNITFSGKVSWWQFTNLPVFYNDTLTDKKQFIVVYDNKVNALGLQASIRYQAAQTFSLGFSGQWLNFYNKSLPQIWHRPGVRFTGDVALQPFEKLTVTAYISFIDELYALNNNNSTIKLNSILDLGAGAEYEVIERINIFLNANNLLNNNYQRWYGYNAYSMNIFGGVRLKF